jgi:hypothetical protein
MVEPQHRVGRPPEILTTGEKLAAALEIIRMREVEGCCPNLDGWWLRVGMDFESWPRVRRITGPEIEVLNSLGVAVDG